MLVDPNPKLWSTVIEHFQPAGPLDLRLNIKHIQYHVLQCLANSTHILSGQSSSRAMHVVPIQWYWHVGMEIRM
jgi:hypothetical protein